MKMQYEDDKRIVTLAKIERILINTFGNSRDSGCYHNGQWMSINSILKAIDREV